jgi:capsular polysaccharide transport system ATP-binding protein
MIALDTVSKSYRTKEGGRQTVLDAVSAEFPDGYNVGVLGANGGGKSTLIRLLAGSEKPDRGRIRRDRRVSFPLGYGGTFHDGGRRSGRGLRSNLLHTLEKVSNRTIKITRQISLLQ